MKNLKFKIIFFLFVVATAQAQERYFDERYVYNQAFLNPTFLNPGAINAGGVSSMSLNYKNQWASFPGSPKTFTLSYEGKVANRLGVNFLVLQDNFSSLQTSKGQLGFSYQINSDINQLGFGLTAEYIRQGLNNFGIQNSTINQDDPKIEERRAGIDFIDASFGVYGVYDKRFTYGIALPSLISSRLDNTSGTDNRELGFILNFGYKVKSEDTGISLQPSVWIKKLNNVPTHIDLNLNAGFLNDNLLGGVNYRVGADKTIGFILGTKIDNIGVYYTYNVSSSSFQDNNNGGHEISAKYTFGAAKAAAEAKDMMH
jgi:type IX secretion system PorP/SprF family membrane protein